MKKYAVSSVGAQKSRSSSRLSALNPMTLPLLHPPFQAPTALGVDAHRLVVDAAPNTKIDNLNLRYRSTEE